MFIDLSTIQGPQISTVSGQIGVRVIKECKYISFPHACEIPTFFLKWNGFPNPFLVSHP